MSDIDVLTIRARQRCALSPSWQDHMDRAASLNTRALLSRFARWCSREGIDPADVDEAAFLAFERELDEFSLVKNPAATAVEARRAWNAAVTTLSGWAGAAVPTRCRRRTVVLPWESFPASFRVDIDHYAARRLKPGKLFKNGGEPLSPVTVQGHVNNLRRFASYLVHDGVPAAEFVSIRALLDPANVRRGLELPAVWGEEAVASAAACHYAHDFVSIARFLSFEDAVVKELKKYAKATLRPQLGLTRQNRERLEVFEDPAALRAILSLPMRIADDLSQIDSPSYGDAVEMRLAALVEILLMAPVRRANLARLDLERHLAWPVEADGEMRLTIPAAEVKNRVPLEYFLPAASTSLLRTYVQRFRPLLIQTPTSALFPGEVDGYMAANSIGRVIRVGLKRHLGIAFNAHLFRHFACMNHLRLYPEDYETPRRLCGHKRLQTLVDHYAGMETEAAVRRFHEGTVLRIRNSVDRMPADEL